jgi:hypothetical protein
VGGLDTALMEGMGIAAGDPFFLFRPFLGFFFSLFSFPDVPLSIGCRLRPNVVVVLSGSIPRFSFAGNEEF